MMPGYSIRILPPSSNKIPSAKIEEFAQVMNGKIASTPPQIFDLTSKPPRKGFDASSVKVVDYGLKATYLLEEEVIIPTAAGDAKNFRKITIECKFIRKEGILLISSSTDNVDIVSKAWADVFFPDKLVNCPGIELNLTQLHELVNNHARTVIDISHVECKGLEKIRMKAYDLPKKDWYKDEGFDSFKVDQITFIPKLTSALANRTPICRVYKSGRFVIYHNAKFSNDEFEQIELQIVDMISKILGGPLCKAGSSTNQGRLVV